MYNPETSLLIQTTEVHSEYTDIPTAPTTNGIQQADPSMAALMLTMMANMEAIRLHIEGNERQGGYETGYHNGGDRERDHGRGRGRIYTGRGRVRGRSEQRRGGKYCPTHGNCAHSSTECETPGLEHKTLASFADMMGGSQNNFA